MAAKIFMIMKHYFWEEEWSAIVAIHLQTVRDKYCIPLDT
jgi:hypothetical protein